jgi:hypoxanthine-guanine phosphoribosyltransferase
VEETGKEVVVIATVIEEGEEMKNVIEKIKGLIVEEAQ